jgi:hypothetical protein
LGRREFIRAGVAAFCNRRVLLKAAYKTHRFKGIFCSLSETFRHLAVHAMLKGSVKQDSNEDSPLEFPKALMPYVRKAPLPVLVRSTLEWLLQQATLEQLFEDTAQDQYTWELTLTFLVDLMLDVASGIQPSALKAFKARSDDVAISRQAFYAKLRRMEPAVSAAVVEQFATLAGRPLNYWVLAMPSRCRAILPVCWTAW